MEDWTWWQKLIATALVDIPIIWFLWRVMNKKGATKEDVR